MAQHVAHRTSHRWRARHRAAVVEALARDGFAVAAADLLAHEAELAGWTVRDSGGSATTVMDVTSSASVSCGRLDLERWIVDTYSGTMSGQGR